MTTSLLILAQDEIGDILADSPAAVLAAVRTAYQLHDQEQTTVPHSTFLRFPGDTVNRIIGLPAYVGGSVHAAGMKWVASFPGNIAAGLPRASATIILNSLDTGQPTAVLEGSLISAHRTAASAALAARTLGAAEPTGISLIGCGVINLEVLRYVQHLMPSISEVVLHDTDPARAKAFAARLTVGLTVHQTTDIDTALAAHRLVSFATSASAPYTGLQACRPGTLVLHVSLRDLYPAALLAARNVVDDPDHVDRERTSVHIASQQAGHRDFIHATIGALLDGRVDLAATQQVTVFSPFGLGALDIAVAEMVRRVAESSGAGRCVPWLSVRLRDPPGRPSGWNRRDLMPNEQMLFKVVVNDEGQYSIWWDGREPPAGWRAEGTRGTKEDCLAQIDEVWTDMRPLSLRRRMESI